MTALFDATIIGGGLAGSMAGILLKKKGWNVLILEKSQYPRHKVCGEFLSPAVWNLFDQIGWSHELKQLGGNFIDSVSFFWPAKKPIRAKLPYENSSYPYAYGISRKTLDHSLLQEAEKRGCAVFQNQEVQTVQRDRRAHSGFVIHARNPCGTEMAYFSKTVIHAAGKQNHRNFGNHRRSQRTFGLKAHFKNVHAGRATELFFFQGGYLGVVDIEDGLSNFCGKVGTNCLKKHGGDFDLLLAEAARQNPALALRLQKALRQSEWFSCGPLKEGFKRGYEGGVFFAGDAACFVEPFLGQGMTMAVAGAFLLSSILTEIPDTDKQLEEMGKNYESRLKQFYASKLFLGHWLRPFAFSPGLGSSLQGFFSLLPSSIGGLLQTAGSIPKISASAS